MLEYQNNKDNPIYLEDRIFELVSQKPYSVEVLVLLTNERRQSVLRALNRLKKFNNVNIITEKKQQFWGVRK